MTREYLKNYSPILKRDMEILVFGHAGARVLFFPTRKAHFYDYENWGVMESLQQKVESGKIQVYCLDSIDNESFYNQALHPSLRILRHLEFEKYIIDELLPFTRKRNPDPTTILAGCSLGAYHAMNIAFRHPHFVDKVIGMSGRYDLTQAMASFKDLFEGFIDQNIYLSTPNRYIPNLDDPYYIAHLKRMEIILAIGEEDAFLEDNKFLNKSLTEKGINSSLHIWKEEAHNPSYWKQMVALYI